MPWNDSRYMNSFVLLWNPTGRWIWPADHLAEAIETTSGGVPFVDQWSVGNRRSGISPGDRCYLVRSAVDRGIVGRGRFVDGDIWKDEPWEGSDASDAHYAFLTWDWLAPERPLPIADLIAAVPQVKWNRLQASGTQVPSEARRPLELLCDAWIG